MRYLISLLVFFFIAVSINCHSHDHAHSDHMHDHGHSDHGHAHAHTEDTFYEDSHSAHGHSDHGHAHEHSDHGHAHEHSDHGHDHDHGHSDHGHAHEHSDHGHAHAAHAGHGHHHGHSDHGHAHGHSDHGHAHTHSGSGSTGNGESHVKSNPSSRSRKDLPTDRDLLDIVKEGDIYALYVKFGIDQDPFAAAIASTAFIGIVPVFIILLMPLGSQTDGKPSGFLKAILAFAVGGLLGDVFLHLIPHAIEPLMESHSHSHGDGAHDHSELNQLGLLILSGMFMFFFIEKFATLRTGGSHGHSHGEKDIAKEEKKQRLRVSAILNMIADATHNFTDGMAIAASFMASYKLGISTTIAVFFHEIPHEIGDMAILAQSGYGKFQIIFIQFLTATGCIAGVYFSFAADNLPYSSDWMLPFIAGGFIYIATVDVIPSLFEKTSAIQTFIEMVLMALGVTLMLFITH